MDSRHEDKPADLEVIYGTFNSLMEPLSIKDVTSTFIETWRRDEKVIIPAGFNFDKHFGQTAKGLSNYLRVQFDTQVHHIAMDDYALDVTICRSSVKNIKLVYYIFVNRYSNWKSVIEGQLLQLKSYGLLDEVDLYVHITDPAGKFDDVKLLVTKVKADVHITTSIFNNFEYPGIQLVYKLAKQDPEAILIYMHTKGISYNIQHRKPEEITLMEGTFKHWRKNVEAFADPKINKIGLFPALELENNRTIGGWIWYNFWYARARYLINCKEPAISANRYIFEGWLGGKQQDGFEENYDCYNLYNPACKHYFSGPEADAALSKLIN